MLLKFKSFSNLTEYLAYECNKIAKNFTYLDKLDDVFTTEKKHEGVSNILAWSRHRNYFNGRIKKLL